MRGIFIKFYVRNLYQSGEKILLLIETSNSTKSPVYLLKWSTVGNIIGGNCFELRKDKLVILHREKLPVRSLNSKDFFKVSGNSVNIQKIDLNELYPILSKGDYTIRINPRYVKYFGKKPSVRSIAEKYLSSNIILKSKKKSKRKKEKSLFFIDTRASFSVGTNSVKSFKQILNVSYKNSAKNIEASTQPLLLVRELPIGLRSPRTCSILGGDPDQQNIMKIAHQDGYVLAVRTFSGLQNDVNYQNWFGNCVEDRFLRVRESLKRVVDDFLNRSFTYDLRATDCQEDEAAYTESGSNLITVCTLFWDLAELGRNSKASRCFHEHCHGSFDALDLGYTVTKCRELAMDQPEDAIRNAQNYEFYATS